MTPLSQMSVFVAHDNDGADVCLMDAYKQSAVPMDKENNILQDNAALISIPHLPKQLSPLWLHTLWHSLMHVIPFPYILEWKLIRNR